LPWLKISSEPGHHQSAVAATTISTTTAVGSATVATVISHRLPLKAPHAPHASQASHGDVKQFGHTCIHHLRNPWPYSILEAFACAIQAHDAAAHDAGPRRDAAANTTRRLEHQTP